MKRLLVILFSVAVLGHVLAVNVDVAEASNGNGHGKGGKPKDSQEPEPLTDACGVRPMKADGSLWSCTLVDEFEGTALDRDLWVPQTSFVTGTETAYACYRDHPDNISVSGGSLHLTVRKENKAQPCAHPSYKESIYTSGMVSTWRKFSQQYGRFEARMTVQAETQPGLQEAFWLWPDDRYSDGTHWPEAGEIDIAETYSLYPHLAIPFLHYTANDNGGPIPGLNTAWDCVAHRGVPNTYALEWSAEHLEVFVNGTSCLLNTSGDKAFNTPYIVAFTQALGTSFNGYDGRATLPATMSIDYIKVWN
ncbi:glycoside hydrolase family 16 protein [Nocardioides limicola]|uniref:glycoside hydrolase family 16 protein n=1 Tax=Nocardioides limicola TaxID=2803368 RepID=UPI00193BDFBA|nr:glycoside hydrolase family 16 protein [Nocardioides sp. DJM-14]